MKHYNLRLNGNIIEATFYDYWNEAILESFISEVKVSLIRLRGEEWGSMTDLRQWKGGNNHFLLTAKAELNRLVAAGSSHAAYIIEDDSPHLGIINAVAPTLSGYKRRIFSRKAEASEWLKEGGFELPLELNEHYEQKK